MAQVRKTTTPTVADMPANLRTYNPRQWPPPLERVEGLAPDFGRSRMAQIASRALWSTARREWLASQGLRTMRDLAPEESR